MAWLTAKIYDRFMREEEEVCLSAWRSALLASVAGEVLEIGAGTGVNLQYYPAAAEHIVLSEPDPHMRRILSRRLAATPAPPNCSVVAEDSQALSFADTTFDAVVCTFVLCSVRDVRQSLGEAFRVLRPGGRLVFLEHVADREHPRRLRWQRFVEPFWRCIADNCHLTRDTAASIELAGFELLDLIRETVPVGPRFASPTVRGAARKPGARGSR